VRLPEREVPPDELVTTPSGPRDPRGMCCHDGVRERTGGRACPAVCGHRDGPAHGSQPLLQERSWNGVRDRLGMVTASTSQTFSFKWRNEEIQLGYDFMAGRAIPGGGGPFDLTDSYRSPPLPVTQGDHLEFLIRSTNGTLPLPSPYRRH